MRVRREQTLLHVPVAGVSFESGCPSAAQHRRQRHKNLVVNNVTAQLKTAIQPILPNREKKIVEQKALANSHPAPAVVHDSAVPKLLQLSSSTAVLPTLPKLSERNPVSHGATQ
jgi:hypothetical protein